MWNYEKNPLVEICWITSHGQTTMELVSLNL
ncbi:hypothetical protein FSU_0376 [Fibrobacter succinogenes subsp. succinogenes S85]|uniref:Uncharacterized protein n=1 Tax=Fibrobacter succinogenes (strain ATCC 19169 / S85) TaxID=59374 RepID=D9S5X4_FIBSS|nr:hypothetical protein FSU_0376 [Fibrobacter succinogenes subsp. succinogenes S85]